MLLNGRLALDEGLVLGGRLVFSEKLVPNERLVLGKGTLCIEDKIIAFEELLFGRRIVFNRVDERLLIDKIGNLFLLIKNKEASQFDC